MADDNRIQVKQEIVDPNLTPNWKTNPDIPRAEPSVIELSSSDSDSNDDSSSDEDDGNGSFGGKKRRKVSDVGLPPGFLDPLPSKRMPLPLPLPLPSLVNSQSITSLALPSGKVKTLADAGLKQFWKAGDYEGAPGGDWKSSGGMDHVRVHPRFLHSNATSHKWVLGAFAELLDNSLDEACNGATYVNIDMIKNKKDGNKMLLIEDNGGGMDPDKMRHCMSLGYSAKSKMKDTIGQYGNGFKTSTMRLGADVIVFSRCRGKNGRRPTQSIGLLSYTFLRSTGKEDIVVPMLDYERSGEYWNKIIRTSSSDWDLNVETIVEWSPFSSEADLLRQFNQIEDQGTLIIVYNLWEDDQGLLELDFDTDPHDIQIRGVNRDEKNIEMAKKYPNSRHFLTYRHSLRSYASILYLRIPSGFRVILRGEDVEHHNIVNDMMMSQEITYRPQAGAEGIPKDSNMVAVVTVGFVKDARAHIDVQGFNVYHKNRLIKPFWRVWHAPGSDGRGVIGVLEANFVEPAHDKQGFERTTVLSRLESKLVQMQKIYWSTNCYKIGYAPRRNKKAHERETSPGSSPQGRQSKRRTFASSDKIQTKSVGKGYNNVHLNGKGDASMPGKRPSDAEKSPTYAYGTSDDDTQDHSWRKRGNGSSSQELFGKDGSQKSSALRHVKAENSFAERPHRATRTSNVEGDGFNINGYSPSNSSSHTSAQLKEENHQLKEENRQLIERLKKKEEEILGDLLKDLQLERERCKSLETQLQEAIRKNDELMKEQDSLIEIFSEERQRREMDEDNYRKKLQEASSTIQELLDKVKRLEKLSSSGR